MAVRLRWHHVAHFRVPWCGDVNLKTVNPFITATILGVMCGLPQTTFAAPITAYEMIADISGGYTDLLQDLQRTRQQAGGALTVENDDVTIIGDNFVESGFGLFNANDFSYAHNVSWLNPTPAAFQSATLTITAYNARGSNDGVLFDSINLLGALGGVNDGLSTTVFNGTAELLTSLLDGMLVVTINKHPNVANANNSLNILSSRLDVTYTSQSSTQPPSVVPEPAVMSLLGLGLLAVARKLRQMA